MFKRKYPVGAEIIPGRGVHFRVWAPEAPGLTLHTESNSYQMKREKNGYFSLLVKAAKKGTLYRFQLAGSKEKIPDPASRFQPEGVNGPSAVIDPKFPWKDKNWPGIKMKGQIIYEMHVGTFTQEGTFEAAAKELNELASLGITLIELMPIAEFPGRFGWGYDGTHLFAPYHHYGDPRDLKAFIDKAHRLGLGVILDVVYNHLGPENNPLTKYSKRYLSEKETEWGHVVNFACPAVKEFFLANARYWMEEFHFDGLRIDAAWMIHPQKTLREIAMCTSKKNKVIIAEDEPQDVKLIEQYRFDGIWNEDYHHSAAVRLTGERAAYLTDYMGTPQELISLVKYGFLFQGQYHNWHKAERGTPAFNCPPEAFIVFLENHDQIPNTGNGLRLGQRSDPNDYKTMCCFFLLGPNSPLIFQGQEFNASAPFHYFAEHSKQMNQSVLEGRKKFSAKFGKGEIPDPSDPATFMKCKLKDEERKERGEFYQLFRDLISLRKTDPVFRVCQELKIDGAVLGPDSFLLRYFGKSKGDRLLIFNFGAGFTFDPAPEPLLAPRKNKKWKILWFSDAIAYGGKGTALPTEDSHWNIPGHSAVIYEET